MEIKEPAKELSINEIIRGIKNGTVVAVKNKKRKIKPCLIGKGLRTKVNANIGTSPDSTSIKKEIKKLNIALKAKTDTVMDLSTGGNIKKIRREIINNSPIPVGTVPIYQVICELSKKGKDIKYMDDKYLFDVIEEQAEDGTDFMTLHCGITKESIPFIKGRLGGIVSRGGGFIIKWMILTGKENPLYEKFDELLKIVKKYGVTISLGDGLRPGAISDASDPAQIKELKTLAKLLKLARKKNVQTIIEGPGHMPLNMIHQHIKLQKKITNDAPYYLLGPIVTDIGTCFDHISAAIGGAIAAAAGADFLCYVTPSEHIRLPDEDDVYLGVIAARIAAHVGDISKGIKGAKNWDDEVSRARKKRNWKLQKELSLDPARFETERRKLLSSKKSVCSMCGKYCILYQLEKVISTL